MVRELKNAASLIVSTGLIEAEVSHDDDPPVGKKAADRGALNTSGLGGFQCEFTMFHPSEAQHGNLDNVGCGKGNDFQSPFRDSCKSSPMALPEDIQYICLGKGKTLAAKFWKVSGCNHLKKSQSIKV